MNNINGINSYQGPDIVRQEQAKDLNPTRIPSSSASKTDQVEISQMARLMSKLSVMPDVRTDKVNTIRQGLADGSYDIESKLPQALDKMLDEYLGNP
jgi:flagellar biosynthesis anti-sigma factor FlgM